MLEIIGAQVEVEDIKSELWNAGRKRSGDDKTGERRTEERDNKKEK